MFDVGSKSIIYKSTAFWPTVKNPINHILDGVVPGSFEGMLKISKVPYGFLP